MVFPLLAACGAKPDNFQVKNGIYAILADGKNQTVTAYASFSESYIAKNNKAEIYLLAFDMNNQIIVDEFAQNYEVIDSKKISEKMTYKFPLANNVQSRLYSTFALAIKNVEDQYTVICDSYCIENPETLAVNDVAFPQKASMKGLRTEMITDAATLGVSHTIVEIPIENFIEMTGTDGNESFIYNGVSHYINAEELYSLDKKITALTNSSINVYLQFLLSTSYNDLPELEKCLAYPNSDAEAEHYAINITDDKAFELFCGLLDFFAKRYTNINGEYGFAGSYILGNAVNKATESNNAGGIKNEDYMFAYGVLVRTAYNILLSNYSNGRVYISLDKNYEDATTELNGNSSAHNFLTSFLQNSVKSGNYYWNIATSIYAEKRANSSSWIEENDERFIGKTILTPANINMLTELIETSSYKYKDNVRKIMVSDMTVNGGEDLAAEQTQGALYAYSYYLMQKDGRIEALIYSSHTDLLNSENSSGLWALDANDVPTRAREIYKVMETIDVGGAEEASYIADIIGGDWKELFRTNKAIIQKRTVVKVAQTIEATKKTKSVLLYNFVDGHFKGFESTDNTSYIGLTYSEERGNPVLHAVLERNRINDYMGIIRKDIDNKSFRGTGYLSIDLMAKLPTESNNCTLLVRLTQASENANDPPLTYEAKVSLAGNTWSELKFDIGEFEDKMNKNNITLSILIQSDAPLSETADYGIYLNSIYIHQKSNTAAIVILIVVLVIGALGAGLIWFFKNYNIVNEKTEGKKRIKKNKKIKKTKPSSIEGK